MVNGLRKLILNLVLISFFLFLFNSEFATSLYTILYFHYVVSAMTDIKNVLEYELTERQKTKIWDLMEGFNFGNVEAYIDKMLSQEYYALKKRGVRK